LKIQNGLFCNLNEGSAGTIDVSTSPGSGGSSIADELTDLRRQVVFLQGQVEDRDRTIQLLEVNNEVKSHCDFNRTILSNLVRIIIQYVRSLLFVKPVDNPVNKS